MQPAAENGPQITKSLGGSKRPFSAGLVRALTSNPDSPPPQGSQPPSGLPIPGEASFRVGAGQAESPTQALQRVVAAQLQQAPGSSAAALHSLQRPPAPLFVGQVNSRKSLLLLYGCEML